MMRYIALAGFILLLGMTAVSAQEVSACDGRETTQSLPEPWEAHTRTFANGEVRVTVLDATEPAAGSFYLLVLTPPRDELGGRFCRIVGLADGLGFSGLTLKEMTPSYDPQRGLTLRLLAGRYVQGEDRFEDLPIAVTINQATGDVSARRN